MLIKISPKNPKPEQINQAVNILKNGGVIAYPTDTIYGIGCDIFSSSGIKKIYRIKGRSWKKPLSFMCANIQDISQYAQISDYAFQIMKQFLPGPYTFIVPAKHNVPKTFIPKQRTVGVRIPEHKICRALVENLGRPMITTSANFSNEPVFTDPKEIEKKMGHSLDLVIDGGVLETESSSVISLLNDKPEILRKGKGDVSWVEEI